MACFNVNERFIASYPSGEAVIDPSIPEKARIALREAQDCLHSPSAAQIMAASAVDAMLKARGLKNGALFDRINEAATQHLITEGMKVWAHDIRLDANSQRHADDMAPPLTLEDGKRCVDFAFALAEFLFVLPAKVKHGMTKQSKP